MGGGRPWRPRVAWESGDFSVTGAFYLPPRKTYSYMRTSFVSQGMRGSSFGAPKSEAMGNIKTFDLDFSDDDSADLNEPIAEDSPIQSPVLSSARGANHSNNVDEPLDESVSPARSVASSAADSYTKMYGQSPARTAVSPAHTAVSATSTSATTSAAAAARIPSVRNTTCRGESLSVASSRNGPAAVVRATASSTASRASAAPVAAHASGPSSHVASPARQSGPTSSTSAVRIATAPVAASPAAATASACHGVPSEQPPSRPAPMPRDVVRRDAPAPPRVLSSVEVQTEASPLEQGGSPQPGSHGQGWPLPMPPMGLWHHQQLSAAQAVPPPGFGYPGMVPPMGYGTLPHALPLGASSHMVGGPGSYATGPVPEAKVVGVLTRLVL